MGQVKREYHEHISGNLDYELAEMLYELKEVDYIEDPEYYMHCLSTLHESGFSKGDALSILNHLLYEEQVEN